ncbi:MAG: hypothetical protein WDN31_00755 [Hyphomicrobium sp.]
MTCRYFRYAQRPEDVVLRALVRKTETIRSQLGSLGQVIVDDLQAAAGRGWHPAQRGRDRWPVASRPRTAASGCKLPLPRWTTNGRSGWLRLKREGDQLARVLEQSRRAVGVEGGDLEEVVGVALQRLGISLPAVHAEAVRRGRYLPPRPRRRPPSPVTRAGPACSTSCARARPGRRESPAMAQAACRCARSPSLHRCATTAATIPTSCNSTSSIGWCGGCFGRFVAQGFQTGPEARHGADRPRGPRTHRPAGPSLPLRRRRPAPARAHLVGVGVVAGAQDCQGKARGVRRGGRSEHAGAPGPRPGARRRPAPEDRRAFVRGVRADVADLCPSCRPGPTPSGGGAGKDLAANGKREADDWSGC